MAESHTDQKRAANPCNRPEQSLQMTAKCETAAEHAQDVQNACPGPAQLAPYFQLAHLVTHLHGLLVDQLEQVAHGQVWREAVPAAQRRSLHGAGSWEQPDKQAGRALSHRHAQPKQHDDKQRV